MPSTQRGCRCETYVAVKKVTRRPILFSQLMRRDGEGAVNPEELFADSRSLQTEAEREREDELRALMRSILDWAISFLNELREAAKPRLLCRFLVLRVPEMANLWLRPVGVRGGQEGCCRGR